MTDVKHGCGEGVCRACAVFLDGVAVNSCSVLAAQAEGSEVQTELVWPMMTLHRFSRDGCPRRRAVRFCTPGVLIGALDAVRVGAAGSREGYVTASPATSAAARATRRSSTLSSRCRNSGRAQLSGTMRPPVPSCHRL